MRNSVYHFTAAFAFEFEFEYLKALECRLGYYIAAADNSSAGEQVCGDNSKSGCSPTVGTPIDDPPISEQGQGTLELCFGSNLDKV